MSRIVEGRQETYTEFLWRNLFVVCETNYRLSQREGKVNTDRKRDTLR